ncbi:hypothetical protein [Bowmanella yangjiangensis]|uniref:Uncharacterized protein n=1 Tax=Bowmanella yangjiangensis TaxID=2811230 RepID=A0ABS3CSV3_9ALTE|nr:hypothetical protein [Bowmanella yangjiangensis]MBN7820208.1 hypothetical protein [Bowmanella yangjiangensis]
MQQDHQKIAQALKRFLFTVLAISSASLSLMIACMWLFGQDRDRRFSDNQFIASDGHFNNALYQGRCEELIEPLQQSSAIQNDDSLPRQLDDELFINRNQSTIASQYYWKNGFSIEATSSGMVARLEIK